MDQFLMWIANNVEKGAIKQGVITVVIPGGIFSGELIPTWRFVEIMWNELGGEGVTRPNGGPSRKGGSDVPKHPVEDPECLHLLAPIALGTNRPMAIPVLRVRIDSIIAWTTGGPGVES